jgi:hypothetical protein
MNFEIDWVKTFELTPDGELTGRWQWVCQTAAGAYRYPGTWLDAESVAPPPSVGDVLVGDVA